MELLEDNKKELEKKYKESFIEKLKHVQISKNIKLGMSKNGVSIISIEKFNRSWLLNSRIDPDYAAQIYAERYQIRVFGVYFVFGLSDGRCIRKLLEKCDDTNQLIILEPDEELFYTALCNFELADIIEDSRVTFFIPTLMGDVRSIISNTVSYLNRTIIEMCILPGYDFLFRDEYNIFEEKVIDTIREKIIVKNTKVSMGRKNPQHTLFHMKNMIYNYNCEQLRKKLQEYNLEHIPAIIVSAGPSLDKNVHELKKAQGKSFIIVVDAALRTVIKAGIRPDIVCTVDFKVPDYFFEGISLQGLIWMCKGVSKPWILEQENSKVFYVDFFCKYCNRLLLKTIGYTLPYLKTGGSVSTDAFSLARLLGFKKIIFIGQDLAFTNGVSHTKGVLGAFGENSDYIKSRCLVKVEGIDGKLLDTDFQMWLYKHWFERAIQSCIEELDVINATEGGANIEGAQNMKLSDAIEKECTDELNIYEIAKNIPPAFTKEQKHKALSELSNMINSVQELRSKLNAAIERQEDILKLLEQNCTSGIKEKLLDMMRDNEEIAANVLLDLVVMYIVKEEYEASENIYVKEEMGIDELVKNNLNLYKNYQTGLDMLEEDIEEYIIKGRS